MADKSTSSLEQVIQTAIDSALKEVHTCLPAVVVRVDHANQLIDAQVTIQRKLAGKMVNLPLLVNVPLRYWRSATFSITFPVEVGDHVKLLFSERSIDTWLTYGGIQNPFDVRKFSLSDAFAEPVMYPQTDVIPSFDTTRLQLKTNDGTGSISIAPNGVIEIVGNTGTIVIQTDGTIEINGNMDTAVAFTDMKAAFDELKTELNAFVQQYNEHRHAGGALNNRQATPAVADMAPAELPTIKVP